MTSGAALGNQTSVAGISGWPKQPSRESLVTSSRLAENQLPFNYSVKQI